MKQIEKKLEMLKAVNEGVFFYNGSNKECLAKPVIKKFWKSQTGVKALSATYLGEQKLWKDRFGNLYGPKVFQIIQEDGENGYVLVDLEYDPWYAVAEFID